ncbi:hypothetical protein DAETH_01500 [Deinococcus aetherius]|uniref:DUF4900 domain-containing protein n=1 Tax=Deinococcus aetherius TaxID=200252 RepID=A0ABM8A8V1_9DEIO|nr:hypothetical protein DAETH_01500 [Deinococcus aetherius]
MTVLIMLLVMSAVLAVTAQITLSSRRSSGDQEATLRAQYAAESGVARSQAQLNLLNSLLTDDLAIPVSTATSEVAARVAALCGVSGTLPASGVLCGASPPFSSSTPSSSVLGTTANLLTDTARLSLFTNYIPDTAYALRGWTLGSTASTNEQAFWSNAVGSAGLTGAGTVGTQPFSSAVRLNIIGVQRLATDQFTVYFTVPSVVSQGGDSTSTRAITINPVNNVYTLRIGRGSFAKYALYTNHHYSSASAESACAGSSNVGTSGNVSSTSSSCDGARIFMTSNTRFSGPVHTNQNFTFTGSPYFGGQVTSAGCPAGKLTATGCNVATRAGAFDNSNFYTPNAMTSDPPTMTVGNATPNFQSGVNWNAEFVALPENGNDQIAAAKAGGLYISGQVNDLSLSVGTVSLGGTSQKAQLISYQQQVSGVATTVNLAYGTNGRMFILNQGSYVAARKAVDSSGQPTGAWEAAPAGTAAGVFNGVIYAQSGVGNLRGPARTSADDPNTAPAAVADFAQLTLASDGDINITTDLKYEDPPCGSGDAATAVCNNTDAKNILGIYSAGGDVSIVNRYVCTSYSSGACASFGTRTPAAPKNVTIQAILMAAGSEGKVTVDGYNVGPTDANDRGRVNLMGGIIENYYGAFGQTNGRGYGRNFVYDTRTSEGITPPSFPTQRNWDIDIPVSQRLQLQGSGTQQARQ